MSHVLHGRHQWCDGCYAIAPVVALAGLPASRVWRCTGYGKAADVELQHQQSLSRSVIYQAPSAICHVSKWRQAMICRVLPLYCLCLPSFAALLSEHHDLTQMYLEGRRLGSIIFQFLERSHHLKCHTRSTRVPERSMPLLLLLVYTQRQPMYLPSPVTFSL